MSYAVVDAVMNTAVRDGDRQLPLAKYLLITLASYASDDGKRIFPSVPLLSQQTGMSVRTIQYLLRDLESLGLISKMFEQHRRATHYRINLDRLGKQPLRVVEAKAQYQN